eukprot:Phypoly_transcript_05992.p1 GENE.Phypoly_transcript_05992~~Phypoly_transcript_05992.p1  ORF type:complete len:284 (-),score=30.26 Phypoly_transcript_05992:929-1780(-)
MESKLKATELGGIESVCSGEPENVSGFYIPPRAKTIKQLLQYTTVEHLLASHGHIAYVVSSDTVETALQAFRDHNVLSVPVYSDDNSKFIGFADTSDILEYFLSLKKEEWEPKFLQTRIKDLIEVSKFTPTPVVSVGTPLLDVLGILSKGDTHRVGITDPANSNLLFNVISQMSLVQFIARNISLFETNTLNTPVSEFMKQIVRVETIPSDTPTHKAFGYLFEKNISGAAVVDESGKVVDTLSASDIVGVLYDKCSHMDSAVSLFLSSTRRIVTITIWRKTPV